MFQKLRDMIRISRCYSVFFGILISFIVSVPFWMFIQGTFTISDSIVSLLSGITSGLLYHELAKTHFKKINKQAG